RGARGHGRAGGADALGRHRATRPARRARRRRRCGRLPRLRPVALRDRRDPARRRRDPGSGRLGPRPRRGRVGARAAPLQGFTAGAAAHYSEVAMFDAKELRRVMGLFATGVTVLTTRDSKGQPYGLTANAVTSLSLEPPLLIICIDKKAETHPHFFDSRLFV